MPYDDQLSVFPNPTTDYLNIKMISGQEIEKVCLYSITGTIVLTSNYSQVDVTNVATGMYILRVIANNKTFTKQIIIK
jgi:hypothetical protein